MHACMSCHSCLLNAAWLPCHAGPLPGAWAGGPPLRSLLLQHNALTGGIPDSWAWLVYSTWEVDMSNNRLVGAIPGSWFNTSLFTGAQLPRISRFGAQ